jgi:hypothetical protein
MTGQDCRFNLEIRKTGKHGTLGVGLW